LTVSVVNDSACPRVRLTDHGHKLLHENVAQREQWLAEAIEQSLNSDERALLFEAGELLDRIASFNR
jgi:DNA-binding MarR family transcriptional regulator